LLPWSVTRAHGLTRPQILSSACFLRGNRLESGILRLAGEVSVPQLEKCTEVQ
jgi:hypothetical protein